MDFIPSIFINKCAIKNLAEIPIMKHKSDVINVAFKVKYYLLQIDCELQFMKNLRLMNVSN